MTRCGAALSALLAFGALAETRADAQTLSGRLALEAIAAGSTTAGTMDDPFLIFDVVGTVRVGNGWDVVVRPWARRMPGGDWAFEMYQLQVRYVSTATRVPLRVDAGIITSPLGLSTLELQPHRNPLISAPFYYFTPLPAVNGRFDRVQLLSGGYPLGAVISSSGTRWDARAGVTDGTPARSRSVFSGSAPRGEPQFVVGGGITPWIGLRLGAGFATGQYRPAAKIAEASPEPRNATVFNLEAEYAVGHTRISGEWVRDRFETPLKPVVARGFNVQASRALSPRVFTAVRTTRASAPVLTAPAELRRSAAAFEAVLGYRLTTELTVRGGYRRQHGFQDSQPEHSAIMSLVWAERWW